MTFTSFSGRGRSLHQDRRPQEATRAELFQQEGGGSLFRVDYDPLSAARETREAGQAVEEFGALFRRERQRLMLQLLGVDGEEADDLAVLLREHLLPERGGRLVEMKLAQIGLVAGVGTRAADQVHVKMDVLPFARSVREFGFALDLHVGGALPQEVGQEFGYSHETQSGELDGQVGERRLLVLLDRVFGVVQGSGHRMRAEAGEFAAAGARPGERAVREAADFGVRDDPVLVAADGAKDPAFDLMAAEQPSRVQDLLGLLEHFPGTGRN